MTATKNIACKLQDAWKVHFTGAPCLQHRFQILGDLQVSVNFIHLQQNYTVLTNFEQWNAADIAAIYMK